MSQKKILNRQEVLDVNDVQYDEIDCPEWGGAVRIRSLSGAQLAQIVETRAGKTLSNTQIAMLTLAGSAVDDNDNLLFTQNDLEKLSEKSSLVLARLGEAIMKLNGMKLGGSKEQKAQEEVVKND